MSIWYLGSVNGNASRASAWDYNASYTVGGWIRFPAFDAGFHNIFAVYLDNSNNDALVLRDVNVMSFVEKEGGVENISSGASASATTLSANTDYWLGLVRNGLNLSMYLGTTPANIALDVGPLTGAATGRSAATNVQFGRGPGGAETGLSIMMEEWRAWTTNLSLAEMKVEAASRYAVKTANLWGDWRMPSEWNLQDVSGNARHLTAGGTLSGGRNVPGGSPQASGSIIGL